MSKLCVYIFNVQEFDQVFEEVDFDSLDEGKKYLFDVYFYYKSYISYNQIFQL